VTSATRRIAIVGVSLVVVSAAHWLVPMDNPFLHGLHLLLRKVFLLPVLLAAVWFGLRGSTVTAGLATALYLPHVLYQWGGRTIENLNQVGELASLWLVALVVGVLIAKETDARNQASESRRGVLTALSTALKVREKETERHSERVMTMARRLGWAMGLRGAELDQLASAALLHDIGKIGTPDRILMGKGPLDDRDRGVVRRHPELGRKILQAVPSLKEVAEIVYSHHERYDGSGYPRGLEEAEIPLLARIFSVVDTFDAIVSDRPYSARLPIEAARHIIARESGKQFDPSVVNAFLEVPIGDWASLLQSAREPEHRLPPRNDTFLHGDTELERVS